MIDVTLNQNGYTQINDVNACMIQQAMLYL